jgi:hypothetical protein
MTQNEFPREGFREAKVIRSRQCRSTASNARIDPSSGLTRIDPILPRPHNENPIGSLEIALKRRKQIIYP